MQTFRKLPMRAPKRAATATCHCSIILPPPADSPPRSFADPLYVKALKGTRRCRVPAAFSCLQQLLGYVILMALLVGWIGRTIRSANPMDRKKKNGVTSLTDREQEILQLIWNGMKNREIGIRLKISVKTVEAHRANMMKKLRVSNAAQLLKAAIEEGFIRVRRA
ncbi:MAG: DNA-binding response regulator [Nitrospiraceae bacterium]|nr:MAG: DNA-binding response regulator [Nitrospiraceae bacterium]